MNQVIQNLVLNRKIIFLKKNSNLDWKTIYVLPRIVTKNQDFEYLNINF